MFNIQHHTLYHILVRKKPSQAQAKLSRSESDPAQFVLFDHDNLELGRGEGDFVIMYQEAWEPTQNLFSREAPTVFVLTKLSSPPASSRKF